MAYAIQRKLVPALCLLTATVAAALPAAAAPVPLSGATATFCQTTSGNWPISASINGAFTPVDGWAVDPQEGRDHAAVYKAATDLGGSAGTELTITLHMLYLGEHELGKFRLAATASDRGSYGQGPECADSNPGGSASWTVLHPQSVISVNGQTLTVQTDGAILASGTLPATDVVTVRVTTPLHGITGLRLEALADGSLPHSGPGRQPANGNFVLTELVVDARSLSMVPALGAWSVALLSLLLCGAGVTWLRRRRA